MQAQWMPIPKEVIARRCTPSFQKVGGARKLSRSRFAQHRPPQTTALASGSTKPVIQYASIQDAQEDLQAVMSAVKALLEAQASTSAQSSTHNQVSTPSWRGVNKNAYVLIVGLYPSAPKFIVSVCVAYLQSGKHLH